MRPHSLAPAPLVALPSVALALALASTLAGCGQKGPLVMPDTDTSGVVIRPSATPAPPGTPAGNTSAPATTAPAVPTAPTTPAAPAAPTSTPTAPTAPTTTPTPPAAPSPSPDDEAATPRSDSAPRR